MKFLSDKMMATEQLEDFCKRTINSYGTIEYNDQHGRAHREDGPARIFSDGEEVWFKHGQLHRVGGPAINNKMGKGWLIDGQYHREDGPAYTYLAKNGIRQESYYLNGKVVDRDTVMALGKMK